MTWTGKNPARFRPGKHGEVCEEEGWHAKGAWVAPSATYDLFALAANISVVYLNCISTSLEALAAYTHTTMSSGLLVGYVQLEIDIVDFWSVDDCCFVDQNS